MATMASWVCSPAGLSFERSMVNVLDDGEVEEHRLIH
jgi:hypothetical protein